MGTKESEMTQDKERPAGSQSLFRGLMLIEILSNYPNGCPLAHLSELAGLNKSTVHRLLQGLQSCGYVTPAQRRELSPDHQIYCRGSEGVVVTEHHPCRTSKR
jgi:DNA-binding MarR family transcriptional regulator